MKVQFDQICALIVFLVSAVLMCLGIDGEVKTTMTLAVGFLVGSGVQSRRRQNGKH